MESPSTDSRDPAENLGYIPIDTFLEPPSTISKKEEARTNQSKPKKKQPSSDDELATRLAELEKKNSELESELLTLKLTSRELVKVLEVIKKTLQEKLGENLGDFAQYEGIQGT